MRTSRSGLVLRLPTVWVMPNWMAPFKADEVVWNKRKVSSIKSDYSSKNSGEKNQKKQWKANALLGNPISPPSWLHMAVKPAKTGEAWRHRVAKVWLWEPAFTGQSVLSNPHLPLQDTLKWENNLRSHSKGSCPRRIQSPPNILFIRYRM